MAQVSLNRPVLIDVTCLPVLLFVIIILFYFYPCSNDPKG